MSGGEIPSTSRWRQWVWPTWSERKRTLGKQAWVVIVVAIATLLFGRAYPQHFDNDSPGYVLGAWLATMARQFEFHMGLLLAIVGAAALIYRQRGKAIAAGVPAVLALMPTAMLYLPHDKPAISGRGIRIMSVNLLMINETTGPITAEIEQGEADVLLLQEYTEHWEKALTAGLGERYPYRAGVTQEDSFGAAIYSRLPFEEPPNLYVRLGPTRLPEIRALVRIDGRVVALYNVHLLPPRTLGYTIEHRQQFAKLLERLRAETEPFALVGDFNFTEASPNAAALAMMGVIDGQDQAGSGRGATWPVNSFLRYTPIPGLRLDHIYVSRGLCAEHFSRGVGLGSDHRPVSAALGFASRDD
ncbi:MAG: hypothetical protein GC162_13225 [Planctomycetes bacterium]|nr:hypothetical protein [Planctomycetota bacterium]